MEEVKGCFVCYVVYVEELGDGCLWVCEGLVVGSRVVVEGGLLL